MTRVLVALALATALAVALTACGGSKRGGGSAAAPAAPSGFTTQQGKEYTFVRPTAWAATPEHAASVGGTLLQVQGPRGTGGLPGQVVLGRTENYGGNFQAALLAFRTSDIDSLPHPVVHERAVSVPGALQARRFDVDYVQPAPKGSEVAVHSVDLLTLSRKHTQMHLLVRAAAADYQSGRLDTVVDSFRLR
jgi:hypothetical protein